MPGIASRRREVMIGERDQVESPKTFHCREFITLNPLLPC